MPQFGRPEIQLPVLCELSFVDNAKALGLKHLLPSDLDKDNKTVGYDTRSPFCGKFGIDKRKSFLIDTLLFNKRRTITCLPCSLTDQTVLNGPGQLCIKCHLKKGSSDRLEWLFHWPRIFGESCRLNNDNRCAIPHSVSFLLSQLSAPDLGTQRSASVDTT